MVFVKNRVLDATVWIATSGDRSYRIIERFERLGHFAAEENKGDGFMQFMSANTLDAAKKSCATFSKT